MCTPLGRGAKENFAQLLLGHSAVRPVANAGFNQETLHLGAFAQPCSFDELIGDAFANLDIDPELLTSPKTRVMLSTTKGDLTNGIEGAMQRAMESVQRHSRSFHPPLVFSNACITGVSVLNKAAEYIAAGLCEHVIVVGCDVLSPFVIYGFQSLFAIADGRCKPYDAHRSGINLGEACGAIVLSASRSIFAEPPLIHAGGSVTNDANHISGPSRTGEGLHRSITQILLKKNINLNKASYTCAHGTATRFNDDMESVAFTRSKLSEIPVNSLKAYFGHTLGAAGVIETAMAMQSLRQDIIPATLGYETPGTAEPLNVIRENLATQLEFVLKTASGFGGGNASLLLTRS